jgi:nicotinamidase/pyrazinamidase
LHDTIFLDVDTQTDFLLPVGSLYVPGAEKIIPSLARLYELAKTRGIRVIADVDAHTEQDPEFRSWPPHCIAGTLGQKKISETLLAGAMTIPNQPGDLPGGWQNAPQVIVEKQTLDVFENSTIERVLGGWPARRYVVFGVVTEICVLKAAMGLLRGSRKIELVTDAVACLDPKAGQKALDAIVAAGGTLTTTNALSASVG